MARETLSSHQWWIVSSEEPLTWLAYGLREPDVGIWLDLGWLADVAQIDIG